MTTQTNQAKKTITLKKTRTYPKDQTTKYWRSVECQPQTVELKTWSNDEPWFILKGIITDSHDIKEIGKSIEIYIQTYWSWLSEEYYTLN
jgi:hypothetical protein